MPEVFVSHKKEDTPASYHPHSPTTTVNMFSTFCENPTGISFQGQNPDEELVLFLRKHFITNISWIINTLLLALIPLVIPFFLDLSTLPAFLSWQFITILTVLYYLVIFAYAFSNFIVWYYDVFIISQQRIVDLDISSILYHDLSITNIHLVQDVIYSKSGFFRSFFNYGDLFIQTAGNNPNFDALAIPNPHRAADIVGNLIGGKPHAA